MFIISYLFPLVKGAKKMGRPKKEKPNRGDGRYEVKICIGERFDGTKIMKSFYSRISKEDAKVKAEQYKINCAVSDIPSDLCTHGGKGQSQ